MRLHRRIAGVLCLALLLCAQAARAESLVTETLVLAMGAEFALPPAGSGAYISSDADIAAVHPSGAPGYARAPGTTSVRLEADGAVTAIARVTVLPEGAGVELIRSSAYVGQGGTIALEARWTGLADMPGIEPPALTLSVADEAIARIEGGLLVGVAQGRTELVAAAGDRGFTASFPVTVVPRTPCTRLSASIPYRMAIGESLHIAAYPSPRDTTDEVRYVSATPEVLTVTPDGVMTAHAPGKALVYVRCGDRVAEQVVRVR